tara:strand:- start:945 stop:1982 length:1038 start_codon:yes stop_codon:yes gene_type:complete
MALRPRIRPFVCLLKILIVKPSSLGDVIQSLPVLRLLKRKHPDSEVHWWLAEGLFPLLDGDPDIDRLIPFNRDDWKSFRGLRRLTSTLRETRARQYDLVIDLQGLARSGVLSWLTRGAVTVGIDLRSEGARMFYDRAVARPAEPHAVDWYLNVARSLDLDLDAEFNWIPVRQLQRDEILRSHPLRGKRIIGVVPGARWTNKRWPVDHFQDAMDRMRAPKTAFAIIGGSEDREFADSLTQRKDAVDLLGQTSLPQMIEWVRRCDLVITNDTGPMHVAAALSKPTVGLFGPTRPDQTGPYGQVRNCLRVELPCAPCMKSSCNFDRKLACLTDISPLAVSETARRLLA